MTVSERLFEFKSIFSLTMSKAAWYARMRHVRDYYSGQQCAEAGIQCLLARISHQDFGFRCICSVSECASGLKSIAIATV